MSFHISNGTGLCSTKARLWVLVWLAVLVFYVPPAEPCTCAVQHPEQHVCEAGFVVMVRVRRQTQTPDGLKAYKVRVKRFLKASDKVQLILTKGLIYTLPGTCQVSLQPRSTYVITGNVEAGKPWTNLCHFTKPWNSLSPKMKKGFRLLYQSGCDCPIMSCHYWERCPKASFMCAWETANEIEDCQGRHAVCLRSANGTCGWLGGRLYRACMKRRRSRTSKATHTNDIADDNNSRTSKVSYSNDIAEDNDIIPRYRSKTDDRHLIRFNNVSTNKRRLPHSNESTHRRRLNNKNESIKKNHNNRIRKPSRAGYGHAYHRAHSENIPPYGNTKRLPIGYVQKEHLG